MPFLVGKETIEMSFLWGLLLVWIERWFGHFTRMCLSRPVSGRKIPEEVQELLESWLDIYGDLSSVGESVDENSVLSFLASSPIDPDLIKGQENEWLNEHQLSPSFDNTCFWQATSKLYCIKAHLVRRDFAKSRQSMHWVTYEPLPLLCDLAAFQPCRLLDYSLDYPISLVKFCFHFWLPLCLILFNIV